MSITSHVFQVGGSGISHSSDAAVYLIKGDTGAALVDAGAGAATERIISAIQSAGVDPGAASELVSVIDGCPFLRLKGLMTIPPFSEDPEDTRPYFRKLRELRDSLNINRPVPLKDLSMGMSHDFEVAIQEGATIIRVGTAIFGQRPPHGEKIN